MLGGLKVIFDTSLVVRVQAAGHVSLFMDVECGQKATRCDDFTG
jgi:hypothetical protein